MTNSPENKEELISKVLAIAAGLTTLLLLFITFVYTEVTSAIITIGALLIVIVGAIAYRNQKALRLAAGSRSARYGANALVTTMLVFCIVMTINFLNYNHFWKKDLTKAGVHSLSEQTTKLLKELKEDVKITAFVKAQGREQIRTLLENYQYASKKVAIEYVDPEREPTRTKAANVSKFGTVIVEMGKKETRIDDATEEKLTNALIKVSKTKNQTICFLAGHGERNAESPEQEGFTAAKQEMASSSWETKIVNLLQEPRIPEVCDAVLILGPNKAYFDKELAAIKEYFDNGGRGLVALDVDIRGGEEKNKQLNDLLAEWFVKVNHNIVVDPLSKMLGVQASVPIVGTFNAAHAITKDFQATSLFPLASSIEILKGPPATLKTTWIAKSTPKSFAETDFKGLAAGQAKFDAGPDVQGPVDMMVAVEGKKAVSRATRDSRLIVMGTSGMASNAYVRHAQNLDLFLNAVSWLINDESLISIRPKEQGAQAITMSQVEGRYIQLLTMILVPLLTFAAGVFVYLRRKRL